MKSQQKKRKWTEDKEWVEKRAKNKGLVKKYGGGGGRSREGVGHEVLSLVQGVGRAIFTHPYGVGHPILLHR